MSPDDPRHGTDAGARAHYRTNTPICRPCRIASTRAKKQRALTTKPSPKVPALGTQRRIQALQYLGHSRRSIAHAIGYKDEGALTYLMHPDTVTILRATAQKIDAVYRRMCMTIPQGQGASRARTWAKKHGYAPPLAWTNIDDPNDTPHGVRPLELAPRPRIHEPDDHTCRRCGLRRATGGNTTTICQDCRVAERRAA